MKPEEKAAKKWIKNYKLPKELKRYDTGLTEGDLKYAFLAGVKWEREQVLKERLDKWDGKNLKKEARKDE